LEKGVLSQGSAPLVERAASFARSIGRTPAEPALARSVLGIEAPLLSSKP
jgi:3-keto-5-aminohexanoate cleavage enzyme